MQVRGRRGRDVGGAGGAVAHGPFDLIRDFTLFLHHDGYDHRCHKPDSKEFTKVATWMAVEFIVMGFIGLFVKLIFIPINNIIVGSG